MEKRQDGERKNLAVESTGHSLDSVWVADDVALFVFGANRKALSSQSLVSLFLSSNRWRPVINHLIIGTLFSRFCFTAYDI